MKPRKEIIYSLLFWVVLSLFTLACNAQTKVKQDANGNFISVKDSIVKAKAEAKPTGKTYTDSKGEVYPVYLTATGKYYIIRTSKKTGNQYKQYLKLD